MGLVLPPEALINEAAVMGKNLRTQYPMTFEGEEPKFLSNADTWARSVRAFANALKPSGAWWSVSYLAPFDSRVAKLATIMFIRKSDGRMLVARRSPDMPDKPGKWGFAGGNANRLPTGEVESFAKIAIRQAREEVGFEVDEDRLGPIIHMVETTGDYGGEKNRSQVQACYLVMVSDAEAATFKPKDETSEIAWATWTELQSGKPYALGFPDIDLQMVHAAFQARKDMINSAIG